ncbi:5771_t:CDS:2 [Racocetra persica]|uniref:5771_t:CDS:1 n=1 Tax=Racocetra persica TaxID=160502 RepID=A0ACA9LQ63_9GLOM|nr:5771_t:CDS:2 [Racocetra persica]
MVKEESATKVFAYFVNAFLILRSRGIISNEVIKDQEPLKEFSALRDHIFRIEDSNYQANASSQITDDKSDFIQLHDDIDKLHNKIIEFVTDLKSDICIHSNKISELLQHYKCEAETSNLQPTQLVKEVLKRLVIDTIIDTVNEYFESNEADDFYPGSNVLGILLKNLCLLTVKKSDNDNNIIKEIPIKERQQIYLFLRNLVFDEDGNHEHWFIHNSKQQLIDTINKYRIINDYSKRKEIEDYASSLIRDVINIFYFRRYTHERIINYMLIKNDEPIDPFSVNEIWDDNVNINNLI